MTYVNTWCICPVSVISVSSASSIPAISTMLTEGDTGNLGQPSLCHQSKHKLAEYLFPQRPTTAKGSCTNSLRGAKFQSFRWKRAGRAGIKFSKSRRHLGEHLGARTECSGVVAWATARLICIRPPARLVNGGRG